MEGKYGSEVKVIRKFSSVFMDQSNFYFVNISKFRVL